MPTIPDHAERDATQIQRRQKNDACELGEALGAMAALLNDKPRAAHAKGGTDNILAATLTRVLAAGGVHVVFTPLDWSADAFDNLRQLALQARVAMRRVRLHRKQWWQEDTGPLMGILKHDQRPVALLPLPDGGYLLEDLQSGRSAKVDRHIAAELGEEAWMCYRKFQARRIGMADLLRFGAKGSRRDWLTMLICGVLGGGLALLTPFATGILVDHVIPDARRDELLQLILLLVTATLGTAAFELVRAISLLRIEGRLGNAMEAAIVDRLINLPATFFRRFSAGDLAQRAQSIGLILQLVTNSTQSAILSWTFGLFSVFYMLMLNWRLGLMACALIGVIFIVTTAINLRRLHIERDMFKVQGKVASRVLQIINGISKLRTGGAENRAFVLWARDFTRQKQLAVAARSLSNVVEVFNASFIIIASAALFAMIAWSRGDVSTGTFFAFNAAYMQFLTATLSLAAVLTETLSAVPLYERTRPILESLPERDDNQLQSHRLQGEVDIGRVSFRYAEDGPTILDDVSIHVAKGEFVAFVGPSGSGKSTLFRLLLGFEKPQSGAIYYDEQDLGSLDAGLLRRQLGVVLQNGKLMPGDIFTNIVGSAPRTLDDAWKAARMAGLEEDIRAMPMGMHTIIAEGAGTISGGQRQRLMIARALVSNPAVILFDEATSALDNRTQAIVADSIASLDVTRIVIAHRLSTIMQADRIFFLQNGKLAESGTYGELIALNGLFAELARRQQL